MYLKYRNYFHAKDEVNLQQIGYATTYSSRGTRKSVKHVWALHGVLLAPDQTTLTGMMAALRQAYSVNGGDLVMYFNDQVTPTDHIMLSGPSIGGTRVTNFKWAPAGGTEYVFFRGYDITLEAEYPDTTNNILEYSETITITGTGGPQLVFLDVLEGTPQPQISRQQTTVRASQVGRALGMLGPIQPPQPIWPDWEKSLDHQISFTSPKFVNGSVWEFPSSWAYAFESTGQLPGSPTSL